MNHKVWGIILFALAILILLLFLAEYSKADPNDPWEFGTQNTTTCWLGGSEGIITCIGPANVSTILVGNITLKNNCADGQILKWSNGVGQCGTDAQGAGGGTGLWVVSGTVIIVNTTATGGVNDIQVGKIYADDWTNFTGLANQITDFNLTVEQIANNSIDVKVTQSFIEELGFNTTLDLTNIFVTHSQLASNISDLENRKLNITDQRFNETSLIPVNVSQLENDVDYRNATQVNQSIIEKVTQSFLEALGFNITVDLTAFYDLRYLLIGDQRYNESAKIDAVNTTSNIEGLGFVTGQHTTDTNETPNVNILLSYMDNQSTEECDIGNYSYGYYLNGSPKCRSDASSVSGSDTKWDLNKTTIINVSDKITINETWFDTFTQGLIDQDYILNLGFVLATTIQGWIDNNVTALRIELQGNIDDNFTYLDTIKLNKTDQRYNDSASIDAVNTTTNIEGLGFVTGDHTVDTNETTRVNIITDENCTGTDRAIGFNTNGTVVCAETSSTDTKWDHNTTTIINVSDKITINETWVDSFIQGIVTQGYIVNLGFWTASIIEQYFIDNRTYTDAYIAAVNNSDNINDLFPDNNLSIDVDTDTDTNAFTNCSVGELLDGGGPCINYNETIDAKISAQVITYHASIISTITGTLDGGVLSDVQTINDGLLYNVSEVTGAPGFDIRVNFTDVVEFNELRFNYIYDGSSGHQVDVELWNNGTSSWDDFGDIMYNPNIHFEDIAIVDDIMYIDANGIAQVRLYHTSPGNANHDFRLDFMDLRFDTGSATITDHGQMTGLNDDDHPQYTLLSELNTSVNASIIEKVTQSFIEALGFVISSTIEQWFADNRTYTDAFINAVNDSDNINDLFPNNDLTTDDNTTCDGETCEVTNTGTLGGYEASELLDDTNETTRVDNLVGTNCTSGDYVSGHEYDGTVVCGTPAGGGSSSEVNATFNNTFGAIRGFTSNSYNGNFSNNSHIGYDRMDAVCNSEYPESHFCLCVEIAKANVDGVNHGVQVRCANGPPGFPAAANDCEGYTKVTDEVGAFWDWTENTGDGAGKLTVCASSIKSACCGGT